MVIHLDLAVPQKLSKTEILAAGSLAYKVRVEVVETRGSMWFYCKGAPKNFNKPQKLSKCHPWRGLQCELRHGNWKSIGHET